MKLIPITNVRLVTDHSNGRYWFEEQVAEDEWAKIPSTDMACEANARSSLIDYLEDRRRQRLKITRTFGPVETVKL